MENENKDVTEETKKENKEEIKEATKEETKEETTKEETKEETNDKTKKSKKGLWIGLGILVVLLVAYGVGAFYYHSHFLYQTSVNDTDCSNLTAAEVAAIMDSQSQQYSLQIFGRDENGVQEEIGTVTAPEIGMNWVDTQGAAQKLLNIQNEFLWIEMLWSAQNYDMVQGVAYDADKLQEQLAQMPALQKKNMIEPEDAYISEYSEKTKSDEIVPETLGSTLDMDQVEDVVSAAIMAGATSVDLEEQGCYKTARVTAEDTALVKACDAMNKWVSAQITYDWNGNKVVVDGDTIHEWIQVGDRDPQLDEEAIAEFVSEQAKEYVKMGYCIGVGGVVTFKNAKKLKQTVEQISLEHILLETDCPYMAPEPHRGTRNDSSNLSYVAARIAEIKGVSVQEVEQTTWENACRVFGVR